jgi:tetratricopeptide (TPR) repeat protein
MTKENVLYSALGLLLGYVVAFTFVTYANLHPDGDGAGAKNAAAAGRNLPPGHPDLEDGGGPSEAALEQMREADKRARENPQDFDLQLAAAEGHAQVGQYEETIDFLSRANELQPDNYEVIVHLGDYNYEAGRFEVAERWYKEALRRNPDDVTVRTDLGLTYFLRRPSDIESALAEFRHSLERDPAHELTLQNITAVLARKANLPETNAADKKKAVEEAEQTLARLEAVNPQNQALPRLREGLRQATASLSAPAKLNAPARGRG